MCIRYFVAIVAIVSVSCSVYGSPVCGPEERMKTQTESELISSSDVPLPSTYFRVTFPRRYEEEVYKSVSLLFKDERYKTIFSVPLQPDFDIENDPLGSPWVSLLIKPEIEHGVYFRVIYSDCIMLGRTLKRHNKWFRPDTGDAGAY